MSLANLLMTFRAIAAYINTSLVVAFPFQQLDSRTYSELRWAE